MKERKLNNKGFSLVELIIVIAIMVILVVVIAPQYTRFVNNSRISSDIQTAQTMATAIDAAIAEGQAPFNGTNIVWANVPGGNVTATPASRINGYHFEFAGDNAAGVSRITITDGTNTYECYPNPESTGTPAGINVMNPTGLRR
jgi:type IV pilus assembly protein PilA